MKDRTVAERQRPALRRPGTYLPGVITAGTYRAVRGHGRQLWDVRRSDWVLVIDVDGERYTRIVAEASGPEYTAEAISAARGGDQAGERDRSSPTGKGLGGSG
ncbi:MAG TPA: hypothetical protein VK975_04830 [Acidimicrobiales bacterium]|nr:hypothetical protein [Acidimicrobiales bacterium]